MKKIILFIHLTFSILCFSTDEHNYYQGKYERENIFKNSFVFEEFYDGIVISDYINNLTKNITIPSFINGKRVKSIGDSAFQNKGIISITLPDTLEEIGWNAFSDNNITSIVIPENVKIIGENAFSENNIQFINIHMLRGKIGAKAFANNGWISTGKIELQKGVKYSYDAFAPNIIIEYVENYNESSRYYSNTSYKY